MPFIIFGHFTKIKKMVELMSRGWLDKNNNWNQTLPLDPNFINMMMIIIIIINNNIIITFPYLIYLRFSFVTYRADIHAYRMLSSLIVLLSLFIIIIIKTSPNL